MSEGTRILETLEQGESHAAEELLTLVYDEHRKLAAWHLAKEKLGHTLQALGPCMRHTSDFARFKRAAIHLVHYLILIEGILRSTAHG